MFHRELGWSENCLKWLGQRKLASSSLMRLTPLEVGMGTIYCEWRERVGRIIGREEGGSVSGGGRRERGRRDEGKEGGREGGGS